jgi:hypothetical protein
MTKHTITAVHEQDLEILLDGLGLTEQISKGQIKCGVCGTTIDMNNLLCIYPSGEMIKVCCTNKECYESVLTETAG